MREMKLGHERKGDIAQADENVSVWISRLGGRS